jgi:UDP-N-acetyl-2-amino-2-deoxyglucuronate dehydrogenase
MLRFGIIGSGIIGAHHARALSGLDGMAQLIAVADPVAERARALATTHGCDWYTSAAELLGRSDISAVCICTPSGSHTDLAEEALGSGKHVVVEKPIDVSLDAADRLLEAQRRTHLKVAVVSQHRFDRSAQLVHGAAQRGDLGRLIAGSAEVPWWRSQDYYDSGTWRGTWRWDGGGALINQSIHTVDLLQWIMGPAVEAMAWTALLAHERIEVEDTAVAAIRFESGAIGTVLATTGAYPGLAARLSIYGERGSAVIDNDQLSYFHAAGDQGPADAQGAGAGDDNQAAAVLGQSAFATGAGNYPANLSMAHREQLRDFCEAVAQDRPPLVDAHEGRQAAALVLALYESARTGRAVRPA